ncbi:hypothetical protein [Enterobacter kobei]|uniref:hypothetical protein n=1 Tax=Enterobacter kobei TaxID=208224 RepID=UPI00159EC1E9|nr:hypothetical protein [Enterobacter kobei]
MSELVKRGHDQAAELKSSCGAVSQLISDLATQLDCTALALREMTKKRDADHADVLAWEKTMFKACGEDGLKSVAEKFAELQDRCAALAAENAGLKDALSAVIDRSNEPDYQSIGMGCGVEDNGLQTDGYNACEYGWREAMDRIYSEVIPDAIPETPETDAFLAEVRAQGADECVRQLVISDDDDFSDAPNICAMVAHQLRKGVQS